MSKDKYNAWKLLYTNTIDKRQSPAKVFTSSMRLRTAKRSADTSIESGNIIKRRVASVERIDNKICSKAVESSTKTVGKENDWFVDRLDEQRNLELVTNLNDQKQQSDHYEKEIKRLQSIISNFKVYLLQNAQSMKQLLKPDLLSTLVETRQKEISDNHTVEIIVID